MKYLSSIFILCLSLQVIRVRYGCVWASNEGEEFHDPPLPEEDHIAGEGQPAGPHITPTTWVVTATTHMPKPLAHALAKDLSKQANYIHWTCYRQEPTLATDKLQCCREIYQLQERDPFHLCWMKRGCQRDKVGRSEFIHYCTEQIVPLHHLEQSDQSIEPRFSLLVAPQLADLPSDQWRQFVSFDSSQGGHWMYEIESPFRLAMDPKAFFASPHDDHNEMPSGGDDFFHAKLSSQILPDSGDDEDFRDFKQKIQVTLPTDKDVDQWTVSLEVLLYLPEAAGLRRTKVMPKCQSSDGHCELNLKNNAAGSVDQQSLVTTNLSLSEVSSAGVTVEWTYSIALDDDNIILPAPFIYSGSAVPREGEFKLHWKPDTMDKIAFATSLDDRDEL